MRKYLFLVAATVMVALVGVTVKAPRAVENTISPVVLLKGKVGHGTGFHVGNGIIVTAAHVAKADPGNFRIKDEFGAIVSQVELIGISERHDLAFYKTNFKGSAYSVNCNDPPVGASITIIGYPNTWGLWTTHGHTATKKYTLGNLAQRSKIVGLDIKVQQGNSGGPVVSDGQVIGVVTSMYGFRMSPFAPVVGMGYSHMTAGSDLCNFIFPVR